MDPDFEVGDYDVIERDENGIPSGTIREMTSFVLFFGESLQNIKYGNRV